MTSNPLLSALRQYRHNQGEGFVFGYDKAETDRIVMGFIEDRNQQHAVIAKLVGALELFMINPTPTGEDFDKARTAIAAYRKQGGDL